MKLLRNGMLLRDEMQPFLFFFQELASCNQLHGTMKENNELFYISLLADPRKHPSSARSIESKMISSLFF